MLIFGVAAMALALGVLGYVLFGAAATPDGVVVAVPSTEREPEQLPALYRRAGAVAIRFTRSGYLERVQHRLDLAGNPRSWGPDRLLAVKGFGLLGGVAFGLLFGAKHNAGVLVLAAVALGALGLLLPDILVRNLGEKRQIELRKRLPDALDTLTVCVEAGLGFDAALGRVARNLDGPVAQECARVLQEMQFGKSRVQALRALAARTDVAELRTFVSAVAQSSELGISIGDVLREQAKQMRVKRRQRAEEKAQKLQIKLLMPLIACLLPAMFTVVLGPAAIEIVGFFHTMR